MEMNKERKASEKIMTKEEKRMNRGELNAFKNPRHDLNMIMCDSPIVPRLLATENFTKERPEGENLKKDVHRLTAYQKIKQQQIINRVERQTSVGCDASRSQMGKSPRVGKKLPAMKDAILIPKFMNGVMQGEKVTRDYEAYGTVQTHTGSYAATKKSFFGSQSAPSVSIKSECSSNAVKDWRNRVKRDSDNQSNVATSRRSMAASRRSEAVSSHVKSGARLNSQPRLSEQDIAQL